MAEQCRAAFHGSPIDRIDDAAARAILVPIWLKVPETARRLRGRCEAIMDFAKVHGWAKGGNPFHWRGNLEHVLAQRQRIEQTHYAALSYRDVPKLVAHLRETVTIPRLALEFQILTAARPSESRLAIWAEIDLDQKIWTVAPARMKAGFEHRVPLSNRAIEILSSLPRRSALVFPGRDPKRPLSASTVPTLLPDNTTAHGMRSAFRDWCGEETSYPREIAEAALAHVSGNQTERAYRRGTALEKRRALMEAWSRYIGGAVADNNNNVVTLGERRK